MHPNANTCGWKEKDKGRKEGWCGGFEGSEREVGRRRKKLQKEMPRKVLFLHQQNQQLDLIHRAAHHIKLHISISDHNYCSFTFAFSDTL
ncbi:hypothetical protein RIF29_28118 [Crotalaria pallida]|uniref:Uncharacterized protein n=1 Tax=Crotalaria pallida TaxID=3830 RepID=A0AAN9EXS1_CROPI